jgi:lipocalin
MKKIIFIICAAVFGTAHAQEKPRVVSTLDIKRYTGS